MHLAVHLASHLETKVHSKVRSLIWLVDNIIRSDDTRNSSLAACTRNMDDASKIQRDRLLAEVDNVCDVLVCKHNSGLVMCKCDDCASEHTCVRERDNFVHRGWTSLRSNQKRPWYVSFCNVATCFPDELLATQATTAHPCVMSAKCFHTN